MCLCNERIVSARIVVFIFHIGTESELLKRWLNIENNIILEDG